MNNFSRCFIGCTLGSPVSRQGNDGNGRTTRTTCKFNDHNCDGMTTLQQQTLSVSKETLCCVDRQSAMDFDYFEVKQSNNERSLQETIAITSSSNLKHNFKEWCQMRR